MKKYPNDTIAAQATPPGRGGIGIVRVSGPDAQKIATRFLGKIPKARYAQYRAFKDSDGATIDEGIVIFFPAPNSFTGEDVLEFHGHGGPVVMDRLLKSILDAGTRLAKPGEFTERAFLNNKIDLAQAEAIADLIDASSEEAAHSAVRSLQGDFSRRIRRVIDALIELRKWIEACIDFPEEEIEFLNEDRVQKDLNSIIEQLNAVLASAKQGTLLQEGMSVVIAGRPNVGKSSLLNQLSGRDTAIVTEIAGTTRDILREYIHIDGMPLHVVDTAGLHQSDNVVEQEGMRRAKQEIHNADMVLYMFDGKKNDIENLVEISAEHPNVLIKNKIDLSGELPEKTNTNDSVTIKLSAKTGEGIDLLKTHLKEFMGYQKNQEGVFTARRRHLDALMRAKNHLRSGRDQLYSHHAGELLAEDLRLAQNALSHITGEFTSNDLLGEIFSSFCIGK